ncbi:DUF444 family protein [Geobacter argillaceus]|uniref:DUF444 family protein n=1 Tax=Geobacter argillaceus TaxID=345631 RepID=A0A562VMT0_9BACT|nr:DUF444 family protein [Geobacter argillaceus]TWJ19205.1 hypothetical protein JN12_01896 [Geobacter argillaceus]
MRNDPKAYLDELKARGLTPEREARLLAELETAGAEHAPPATDPGTGPFAGFFRSVYAAADLLDLQRGAAAQRPVTQLQKSLDELLERDRRREEDGFPRKIRVGKLVKPGRGTAGKVVVVPTTEEEKFIHDPTVRPQEEGGTGGTGDEGEGEVIGEQPVRPEGQGTGTGPGQGEGEAHELESSAYDLGKTLTEKFQLPNLKEKGKKRSLTRYTYDLTDRNRGFGQVLDKKATLRKIIESNISLGNIPDVADIDPSRFLIAPRDKVYRILSREKDFDSQAMVFFLRDYSGSMSGKVTELVATQHVLIYSWLIYQYAGQVESRFILHDTEAKEVPDFYTYYNSQVAGGTEVASAYRLVNEIVAKEGLAKDYNIYVFHGTDGDDWDSGGDKALPELRTMIRYASRVGVTVAEHGLGTPGGTEVSRYLENSGLLTEKSELIRLDVMQEDADEPRLIEGIKKLIS